MGSRIPWNQQEAVLLVDTYIKVRDGVVPRKEAVSQLSKLLREYGASRGIEIDEIYRNENGISMRLEEINYLFHDETGGLKNTSRLFKETVALYRNNKPRYEELLSEAKSVVSKSANSSHDENQKKEYIRTGVDSFLAGKYPLLFARTYEVLKSFEGINVTAHVVWSKLGGISRISTVKKILDDASWSKCDNKLYTYSSDVISHTDQNDSQTNSSKALAQENEFYSWLETHMDLMPIECSKHTSGLAVLSNFLTTECDIEVNLYEINDTSKVKELWLSVQQSEAFASKEEKQKWRLKTSVELYMQFLGGEMFEGVEPPSLNGKYGHADKLGEGKQIYNCKEISHIDSGEKLTEIEIPYNLEVGNQMSVGKLISILRQAENGMTLDELESKCPEIKKSRIKKILDVENKAAYINEKYYHIDNIEDLAELSEIMFAGMQELFQRHGGYTSSKLLFEALRMRLEDFFFDNNGRFESEIEVYELARYLFEKVNYKGQHYIFSDRKHVWAEEPDYPKSYLGILSNWARQQNGIASRDEMLEWLEFIGAGSPQATFSFMMRRDGQNSKERLFLMYDEYDFVLTEKVNINDDFLLELRTDLEELLDGDDYLPFDEVDDYFYTMLPTLPSNVVWTPHMIKSIAAFYDIGFTTFSAGDDNDIKVPDPVIVRKDSSYKLFSDVLWSEINHDYELPREFSNEEFRLILLRKGFIHGHEKTYNVHNTVQNDLRFLWTNNNSKVTVSKK